MPVTEFSLDALPRTEWKNREGYTREIVRQPADAPLDRVDWRVSVAELTKSGAFSIWTGYDRVIALLDGAGAVLGSNDAPIDTVLTDHFDHGVDHRIDHRLDTPWMPFHFSGDRSIFGALIDGPSTDFNVLTRRGAATSATAVIHDGTRLSPARAGVLLACRGVWRAAARDAPTDSFTLRENSGLWWVGEAFEWELSAIDEEHSLGATLLAVSIDGPS